MVTLLTISCTVLVLVAGVLGSHGGPECPRHRGLPDGFVLAENRYKERAVFRMDLRNALKGYIPEKEYRFRVQTTVRKNKFNDATLVIDPLDTNCGAGSWVITSDLLYSPKDCPSVVTTQQKEPMGRAHFVWKAPSCGCVHFRVRVHVNSTYYIEDESVHNGPLARTVCPKPGTVKTTTTTPVVTTTTPSEPQTTLPLSRDERLALLCDVTRAHKHGDVTQYDYFTSRRHVSNLNQFEKDRVSIAVQRRHMDVLNCCDKSKNDVRMNCFGDIRRVSIDAFCGDGEAEIPLAMETYDWIKKKEPECCPQIGEHRYNCFNQSLHDPEMMRDSHENFTMEDLDDFDPVNFIEDYPAAGDIREKFIRQKMKSKLTDGSQIRAKTSAEVKHKPLKNNHLSSTEDNVNDNIGANMHHTDDDDDSNEEGNSNEESDELHDADEDDDYDDDDDTSADRSDENKSVDASHEDKNEDNQEFPGEDESSEEDTGRNKDLPSEECCRNGIDAGTRVFKLGFEGCFKMANRYQAYFTKWDRKCDLSFAVCCMRVIDGNIFKGGDSETNQTHLGLPQVIRIQCHACKKKPSNHTVNTQFSIQSYFDLKNRTLATIKRLFRKQIKSKNQNLIIKSNSDQLEYGAVENRLTTKDKNLPLTKIINQNRLKSERFLNKNNSGIYRTRQKAGRRLEKFKSHKMRRHRIKHVSGGHLEHSVKHTQIDNNETKYLQWKQKIRNHRQQNEVIKT